MLFNYSSSISSDKDFYASICNRNDFFSSPSVFVYTLPNIVTGEIAIRNGYHGETSFIILSKKKPDVMKQIVSSIFMDRQTSSLIAGWINANNEDDFEAELYIAKRI